MLFTSRYGISEVREFRTETLKANWCNSVLRRRRCQTKKWCPYLQTHRSTHPEKSRKTRKRRRSRLPEKNHPYYLSGHMQANVFTLPQRKRLPHHLADRSFSNHLLGLNPWAGAPGSVRPCSCHEFTFYNCDRTPGASRDAPCRTADHTAIRHSTPSRSAWKRPFPCQS